MLITLSSVHMKNAFIKKSSIQINHRRYAINYSDRFSTYLNVYDALHEMSDGAIIKRLEPYCEVVKGETLLGLLAKPSRKAPLDLSGGKTEAICRLPR